MSVQHLFAMFVATMFAGLISGLNIPVGSQIINISGLFVAVIVGVLANLILPNRSDVEEEPTEKNA